MKIHSEISSRSNADIKHLSKLFKSSSYRKKLSEFALEGARICHDAAISGVRISALYITKKAMKKYAGYLVPFEALGTPVHLISEQCAQQTADTTTPQGVFCLCDILASQSSDQHFLTDEKCLGLENIQDPANLGTIVRTAEAVGIKKIFLSEDSCDIYNPKVVRGSMGGIFRINIFSVASFAPKILEWQKAGITCYAMVADKTAQAITSVNFVAPCISLIGNEGNGLKPNTVIACSSKITIPMNGNAESLNASMAAGITMWEMLKND